MGYPPPTPATPTDEISYTTAKPAVVGVQPGRLRVHGSRKVVAQRIECEAGGGPGGGTLTARWLRNGATLGTITVADAAESGALVGAVALVDGDLLTFEVLTLHGATGAVVGILDQG